MRRAQLKSPKRRRSALIVLAGVAVLWVAGDQLTKLWALNTLPTGQNVPIVGETLMLHLTFNPGAAFSFLSGATWVFTLLAALVSAVLISQAWRIKTLSWACALGLLLGGTVGNLIDRLFRPPGFAVGHVVDFIYTPWLVPAVYNVADIGLCVAVPLLVLLVLFNVPADPAKAAKTAVEAVPGEA